MGTVHADFNYRYNQSKNGYFDRKEVGKQEGDQSSSLVLGNNLNVNKW